MTLAHEFVAFVLTETFITNTLRKNVCPTLPFN